ncbi:MAG: GTPase domain-containing protein [Candidatus Hodarchaeales archaeon]|jgi:GTPase SAR1 family protein
MNLRDYLKAKRSMRKILLLGSETVGKTSLIKVLKEDKSLDRMEKKDLEYKRTSFFELETITASGLIKSDNDGTFQIWDLAGQFDLPIHPLRDISSSVLGSIDLVILMFSSDNPQTLLDLAQWINIIDEFHKGDLKEDASFILINNQFNLSSETNYGMIEQVMNNEPRIVHLFEISCLTGKGLKELKEWLVSHFFAKSSQI